MTNTTHTFATSMAAFCAALAFPSASMAQGAATLSGCASDTPPTVIMKNGRVESGFSVDLFSKAAAQFGRSAVVYDMPWARCLVEVRAGRVDVAIDAFDDPERRKLFHYTKPYHTLTPQIFYRASADPKIWPVKTVTQLKQFKGCGLLGYTYEHYELDAKTIDLGAKSDHQMLQKLIAKRCDYAVEELEYVVGARNSDKQWPDESGLRSYQPSWAKGPRLHFLVGHDNANGQLLQEQLNGALAVLEKQGEVAALRRQYFETKVRPKPIAKDKP